MKVFVLIAVVALLSGANANGFTDFVHDLKDGIGNTLHNIIDQTKPVMNNLLESLVTQAKQSGVQLLNGIVGSLGQIVSSVPGATRRDIAMVSDLMEKGKAALEKVADTLRALFHGALSKLSTIANKIQSLDFLKEPFENILSEIKNVVNLHGHLQLGNLEEIMQIGKEVLGSALHKRSGLFDGLNTFANTMKSLFKPITDMVTKHVSDIGSSLATAASGIVQSLNPNFSALKDKLSEHVNTFHTIGNTLLQSGKDAMNALKDAAVDILGQTFKNAVPAVQQLVETGKSAAGVIKDHLAQTLGGH